jgi:flagellar motor switch protein FliN/FliY
MPTPSDADVNAQQDPALDEAVGAPAARDVVEEVTFPRFEKGGENKAGAGIDRLLDVRLTLSVELGRRQMLLQEVLNLGQGSILDLEKSASDLVDVLINGKLLARGEVVVIGESFGVRITSLVDPIERVKRMGGTAS